MLAYLPTIRGEPYEEADGNPSVGKAEVCIDYAFRGIALPVVPGNSVNSYPLFSRKNPFRLEFRVGIPEVVAPVMRQPRDGRTLNSAKPAARTRPPISNIVG